MLYGILQQQARMAPLFARCQIEFHDINEKELLVRADAVGQKKKWNQNWKAFTHFAGGMGTGVIIIAASALTKNGEAISKLASAVLPSIKDGGIAVLDGKQDQLSTEQRLILDHWMQHMSSSQRELSQASDKIQEGTQAMLQADSAAKQRATGG